ncbi:ligand-binding sensor domain-containing protein [Acanthopleuribacter pedis]|uniref:Diguanylate cyclase n=1 Tax=Acanthopleuribacter pedis TaxID=442870 RepID=A0A8J7QAY9_9BACT|nr:two-component regulator propeller domain-containing protein [Acanthopleuribacter pedis]MBO1320754.1 diguanylate cyclase [Acanthopleuribacter pedis]
MFSQSPSPPVQPLVLILWLICLLGGLPLLGQVHFQNGIQSLKFDHISIREGLSQSTIYDMAQDAQGFMWFGTQDGLNRFDGYRFEIYRFDPGVPNSLSDNEILSLAAGEPDHLWIGTHDGGLNLLNLADGSIQRFRFQPDNPTAMPSDMVRKILYQDADHLWLATDQGLVLFNPNSGIFKTYANLEGISSSLSNNDVTALARDRNDRLWVGTNGGLNYFNPANQRFVRFEPDDAAGAFLRDGPILCLALDSSNVLWIGTQDAGLFRFDPATRALMNFRHDPKDPHSLSHNLVRTILEDHDGRVWVGTREGLNYFEPTTQRFFRHYHDPHSNVGLAENTIYQLFEDRSGLLWVGTANSGINKLNVRRSDFQNIGVTRNPRTSLSTRVVWSISEGHGSMWFGSDKGLNRMDPKTHLMTHYRHDPTDPDSLADDTVRALHTDKKGRLWIGTVEGGLHRYDPASDNFIRYPYDEDAPHALPSRTILSMAEDPAGGLWIGTGGMGLAYLHFARETVTHYQESSEDPNSLSGSQVYSLLFQPQQGLLWAGTLKGLNRFNVISGRWSHFRFDALDPTTLSNDGVGALLFDQMKRLWVGTDRGLNLFMEDTESFRRFTQEDGLPNDFIYGMMEDRAGFLWISTNKGIARMDPVTFHFKTFDIWDGLQSNEFNAGAYFENSEGRFFFGGINGVSVFDPLLIQENNYIPPVVFTEFKVSNDVIQWRGKNNKPPLIKLSHDVPYFSFEFVALDYNIPEKNRYRYKLEGFDNTWREMGTRRYGNYSNLAGGTYTLRVQGANNDGKWNETGASAIIKVSPPPWQTIWAYLGYFLALSGLVYTLVHFKTRRESRRLGETMRLITRDLSRSLDLQVVMSQLLENLEKVIPYQYASLYVEQEGRLERMHTRAPGSAAGPTPPDRLEKKLNAEILKREEPLLIPNRNAQMRWTQEMGGSGLGSILGMPLEVNQTVIGMVYLYHGNENAFNWERINLAVTLVNQAGIAVENARLYTRVKQLATTDDLTQLYNRRYFFELAEREFERSARYQKPLSIVMFDIDHFKQINDLHGHHQGDLVIQFVAEASLEQLRKSDFLARYGGEEFIAMLPETNTEDAIMVAERLKEALTKAELPLPDLPRVTASYGIATLHDGIRDLSALVEEADRALYRSKNQGRDQISVFQGALSRNRHN